MKKSNYSLYLAGLINEYGAEDFEGSRDRGDQNQEPAIDQNSPEFRAWLTKFEEEFPGKQYPGMSLNDQRNLYTGRILTVLDETGETDKWTQYASTSNLKQIISNYESLVLNLVRIAHPDMLEAYKQWHSID
jgi:hypothetical protein